jgi:hypothetical protein
MKGAWCVRRPRTKNGGRRSRVRGHTENCTRAHDRAHAGSLATNYDESEHCKDPVDTIMLVHRSE